ncbi:MAG TPA: carbohydrate porin [Terrimicrobiaceae bacterium]
MPFLPLPFLPQSSSTSRPRARGLLLALVAGATCLGAGSLFAETSDADIEQLKAQMQKMQEDYAKMEAKVKSMEAQVALSASIAQSRKLTGPDGKEISLEGGPVVIPALDTFTRNFKTSGYVRAGTGFTGNGVGQTSDFKLPQFGIPSARMRLGNENDTYLEFSSIVKHMLGDDPDVMDVTFRFTLSAVAATDKRDDMYLGVKGMNIGWRELYLEFKNVIKSAPEVTFWGGQRFYDRYDIHPQDYFFLNDSGVGGGVYNIDLGIGSLAVAYLGGIQAGRGDQFGTFNQFDLQVNGGEGSFYRHTLDLRLGDIDALYGKLKLVLLGSFMKGGNFTTTDGGDGHVEDSGGVGGGIVYQYDLPPQLGKLSFLQVGLLYGWGLVDFDPNGVPLDRLNAAYNSALVGDNNAPLGTFESVDPFNNAQRARANFQFVWNPTDNFAVDFWGTYQFDDQGFTSRQVNSDGSVSSTGEYAHLFTVGVRPVYWLWGPLAIQGQAGYNYISNVREPGSAAFGNSGSMGIFTIAPTLKPRGGFFTRPELRLYATFAVWSDELKGAIGAPYYANNNYGWNFGIQAETFW